MTAIELSFEETGNPDGPTLVLIHGFMSSNTQWMLNRERLGERLRLVLVEQMGHGRSPAPDEVAPYRPLSILAALEAVRRRVGVERWWVGGHSLGGAIAIRYALANPDRTNGLIFTNTRAAFGVGRRQRSDDASVAAPIDSRAIPFHPIHAKRYPEAIKARLVADADAMATHALANTTAVNRGWRSVDELHRLTMPTMLVNGRWEKVFRPCIDQARNAVPQLELVELEGGHSINIEQPEAFDRAVLDFVDRHSG